MSWISYGRVAVDDGSQPFTIVTASFNRPANRIFDNRRGLGIRLRTFSRNAFSQAYGEARIRCSQIIHDSSAKSSKAPLRASRAQLKEGKLQSPCRSFTEFEYSTLKTWSKARRVIGKAEILPKGDNPRFVVTTLLKDGWGDPVQAARFEAAILYEKFYCARGDMENRIKEQQLDLFADRTGTLWMASNQLRLDCGFRPLPTC